MNLTITIGKAELIEELERRGEMLQAAILQVMNELGGQLQERAQSKIAPVIRTEIGQEIFDSITLQAAAYVGQVCETAVYIENDGQPSFIVAYVREFGGESWYDIYPHEMVFAQAGLGGSGRISLNSAENSQALAEGRLPHSLAWVENGQTVFARHVWHPPAKEQSYLRSSLAEMQGQIRDDLIRTLAEVLAA